MQFSAMILDWAHCYQVNCLPACLSSYKTKWTFGDKASVVTLQELRLDMSGTHRWGCVPRTSTVKRINVACRIKPLMLIPFSFTSHWLCPVCWSRSQKIATLRCSPSMGRPRRSCFAARAPKWSWRWRRRGSRRCCLKGNRCLFWNIPHI